MNNKNNTSEYTEVVESTEQSEYTEVVKSTEQSEYTEVAESSENSEYTKNSENTIESEYTEQSENKETIEDHEIIHARMVSIFRKLMVIFSIALLIATGIIVCFLHTELSTALGFFAFSIVFPAFIYKISINTIRNYPL